MRTLTIIAFLAACSDPVADTGQTAPDCGAPYSPFDAANYENQLTRVAAYEQIVALRKHDDFAPESFDTIEALYVDSAELSVKVSGRTDPHSYALDTDIGVALDADITAAIAAGKAGDDIDVQGQIVDKTLQRFFGLSVFYEMTKADDEALDAAEVAKGWDEAFGYFGVSNDGTQTQGIATTLAKRDAEFSTSLLDETFNALLDGRCALEDDDRAAASSARDDADTAITRGFALSIVHEMDEYDENPLIKGWEAVLYYNAVRDWVVANDPDAATTIDAEFAAGVDQIDPSVVRAAVTGAFGFEL
jgi:hypothetical protein